MNKQFLGLVTILTVLGACQKNEVSVELSEAVTIHATIDDADATKTIMDESNNVLWSENDQIIAFMKSSYGHKYQVKSSFVGKSYADFSRISSGSGDDLSAGNEWDHNVVYYPFSENIECLKSGSNYALEVNLPSEQVYVPDSFANSSMAMVAVSENNNITFNNVLGGIKLHLKGTQTVKSIKIEGKNNEKLSGAAVVTAYTDGNKPAITMASDASTSVTLNCGVGVQLNENKATEFIISLPPVLFGKGFTVTVTDAESKTYTVETDKANTVLRSSLLVMPTFKLGTTPAYGGDDDAFVTTVFLDKTSLTLAPGTSYTFETDFDPYDASNKTLSWSSSSSSVASVDQNGRVIAHADGTAVISAVAFGGASASCTVNVISCITPTVDYVDEYGINHGKGIAIGNIVWAPVNCGYKAPSSDSKGFPYGKLYQWGRKYGQGYSSSYDESEPELVAGPVMPGAGQDKSNAGVFFVVPQDPYNWCNLLIDDLWLDEYDNKSSKDPCPDGWRVPSDNELNLLSSNCSTWTTNTQSQNGRYFSGEYTYVDGALGVFLPAAGMRSYGTGNIYERGSRGCYWSGSKTNRVIPESLYFSSSFISSNGSGYRATGASIRCVQE